MAGLVEQPTRLRTRGTREAQAPAVRPARQYLSPFDNLFAPAVASWPRSLQELTWLAPGTSGPLTASKVCGWKRSDGRQFLFWDSACRGPCGYAELNRMPDERRRYWIGHFIIDPAQRGRGLSHIFFRNLVIHAFEEMGAAEVLLVVIPENAAAVRCYEQAGMTVAGRESKRFANSGRRHTFLRMSLLRKRFDRLDLYRSTQAIRAPFVRSALNVLNRGITPPAVH